MRLSPLIALAAFGMAGHAAAQPGYGQPGYGQPGYDQPGYPPPGCAPQQPAPPPRDTMPSYHEEKMPAPPPGGGYHDSYGTADVEAEQRAAAAPAAVAPHAAGRRDPAFARAHYAARIARWRARAAACEAGDLKACEGPAG